MNEKEIKEITLAFEALRERIQQQMVLLEAHDAMLLAVVTVLARESREVHQEIEELALGASELSAGELEAQGTQTAQDHAEATRAAVERLLLVIRGAL